MKQFMRNGYIHPVEMPVSNDILWLCNISNIFSHFINIILLLLLLEKNYILIINNILF